MPSQYCSNCGYENKFSYTIPTQCRACSKPFFDEKATVVKTDFPALQVASTPRYQPRVRQDKYKRQEDIYEEDYHDELENAFEPAPRRRRSANCLADHFAKMLKISENDQLEIEIVNTGNVADIAGTESKKTPTKKGGKVKVRTPQRPRVGLKQLQERIAKKDIEIGGE